MVMNVYEASDNRSSDTTSTLILHFYEDWEGLWSNSFSDNHPVSSRKFTYSIEENKLVMVFADGKIEEYIFSINEDVLSLEGKLFSGDLARED